MTPLKAASRLPFHRTPVKEKSIFNRELDSGMFGALRGRKEAKVEGKTGPEFSPNFSVLLANDKMAK